MFARVCAVQMARQIVRALHLPAPEPASQDAGRTSAKQKTSKASKARRKLKVV